jgi:PmbA protein
VNEDTLALAGDIVEKARRLGADEVDAYVVSSTESSVQVRRGETERVVEAGSHAVGIRVIKAKRTAICSTSDLTPAAIDQMVRETIQLASISEPDEYAGLPSREDLALGSQPNLQLYDEAMEAITADEMREFALRMEAAAFDYDKHVTNSDGAEMAVVRSQVALANSLGFGGTYMGTHAALSIEAMCDEPDGKKRNDYWFSAERALHRGPQGGGAGRGKAGRSQSGHDSGARDLGSTGGARPAEDPLAGRFRRGVVPALDVPGGPRRAAGGVGTAQPG